MTRARHPDPDSDRLAGMRADAARRALELVTDQAPDGVLERVAWAVGAGSVDRVRDEVEQARRDGYTWPQIGAALGEHADTARIKYSPTGYAAQRRYRERQRSEGEQ